jgi:hypothetical protein
MVDGATPDNKDIRTQLFTVSGLRGVYPQLFSTPASSSPISPTCDFTFLGTWNDIHTLNERNELSGGFDAAFAGITRVEPGKALLAILTSGVTIDMTATPTPKADTPTAAASGKQSPESSGAGAMPVAVKGEVWAVMTDEDGDTYYWNNESKETSWVDPRQARAATGSAELLWVPQIDDKGRQFYYNYRTGETRWSL